MHIFGKLWSIGALAALIVAVSAPSAHAQVTPAAGYTPPDDTPAIRVGATLFGDYTITAKPKTTDADGNVVTSNAFNVGRAYINVTGNISHLISFRVTPDIARETGSGSSLTGSQTFRLKYAYGQFNLDEWTTRGTWVRLGMQQTPWVDFMENLWRYRFQGTIFEDREGFLSSSDNGVSFHSNFPGNYGDVHTGIYNGETYTRAEANDQKAFMIRASFRPLRMHPVLRGMRVTGFYDHDAYVKDAERRRAIGNISFEHQYVNASFNYFTATDQTRTTVTDVDARGFSVWVTPKHPSGWEGILRYDWLEPNRALNGDRARTIVGGAYWFPKQGAVSTALLLDYENVNNSGFTPVQPDQRRLAVHMLVNWQ
jgi:hypothetical protein